MIRVLDTLSVATQANYGGKADGLAALVKVGAPVPATLCIAAEPHDLETFFENRELISAIQEWVADSLPTTKWIVRSSHVSEDTLLTSSAGLYPSLVVEVAGESEVLKIIRTIYDVFALLLQTSLHSAVLLQPFITGMYSGVLFTSDPNVGRRGEGILTFVDGPCSSLVDGSATPTTVAFSPSGLSLKLPLPLEVRWDQLLAHCSAVEKLWDVPVDCEFTLDESGNLIILQARPVAVLSSWKRNHVALPVGIGEKLPVSVERHPKIQLRFGCHRRGIPISPAWIATETCWEKVSKFDLPQGFYTSVLIHPELLDGKIRRRFSRDGYSGAAAVLAEAKDYWVRHAIVAEVLPATLTGMATLHGTSTIVEVAKGHFVPKGLVDTTVYEAELGGFRLVHQPQQEWFYDIDPENGEAVKRPWLGYASLEESQLQAIASVLRKLELAVGDCLEFGVLEGGDVVVIDIQRGRTDVQTLRANQQVISLGEAEGTLCILDTGSADGTEGHFFEYAASHNQTREDVQPVVIAAPRPDIGLLREFERLAFAGMRVVAAIFEVYSPLCHLSVLLREWGIPSIVIPAFRQSELSRARSVRVTATTEGARITVIQ